MTGATVGYNGEQWFRAGATSNDRLDFPYKILTSCNPATPNLGRLSTEEIHFDNGYFIGEHGRGDKRAAYEVSLHIPFMIRYHFVINDIHRSSQLDTCNRDRQEC